MTNDVLLLSAQQESMAHLHDIHGELGYLELAYFALITTQASRRLLKKHITQINRQQINMESFAPNLFYLLSYFAGQVTGDATISKVLTPKILSLNPDSYPTLARRLMKLPRAQYEEIWKLTLKSLPPVEGTWDFQIVPSPAAPAPRAQRFEGSRRQFASLLFSGS